MRYNFLNNFRYLCEAKAFVILMEKDVVFIRKIKNDESRRNLRTVPPVCPECQ